MLDRVTGGTLDLTGAARLDARRRVRLHRSSGERTAWLRAAQWGIRPRQGGPRARASTMPQAQVLDPRVSGKARDRCGAERERLRPHRRAEGKFGRRPAARPQDIRPRARSARQSTSPASRRDGLGLRRYRRPSSARLGACRQDAPTAAGALDNLALSLASARLAGALAVRRGSAGDWRPQLQRHQSRRSVAARAHEDERRAPGESQRLGRRWQASASRSPRTATE